MHEDEGVRERSTEGEEEGGDEVDEQMDEAATPQQEEEAEHAEFVGGRAPLPKARRDAPRRQLAQQAQRDLLASASTVAGADCPPTPAACGGPAVGRAMLVLLLLTTSPHGKRVALDHRPVLLDRTLFEGGAGEPR